MYSLLIPATIHGYSGEGGSDILRLGLLFPKQRSFVNIQPNYKTLPVGTKVSFLETCPPCWNCDAILRL